MRKLAPVVGVSVIGASLLSGLSLYTVHASTCKSQNRDLVVLQDVLTTMLHGPHALNGPVDKHRRLVIYNRQVALIHAAECH